MIQHLKPANLLKWIAFSTLMVIALTSCKDDDPIIKEPIKEKAPFKVRQINEFIDDNMSFFYFWNDEMPKIDPDYEFDSEEYFNKLLKKPDDRWSFITDDYKALKNYFAGIQRSVGYSLMLIYKDYPVSNQVLGFIEYVYRDSPASEAGLKRGDMLYKIDGQIINDQNYNELLSRNSFVLTLGKLTSTDEITEITEISPSISLTTVEELAEHPVIATSIIETGGHKIGYLAYSSFTYNYDTALVSTFEQFKSQGVTEVVLDLRYNGGGAVSSAALLGDMLVPPGNEGNTFIRQVYNDDFTNAFIEELNFTEDSFKIVFEPNRHNLNVSKLYVLTTSGTASASEMVIYGLDPYMEVIQIGDTTVGKYYGSITLDDEEKHNWAIQPIVMRSINAPDNINYKQGLPPDIPLPDYFYHFTEYQLGDPMEPFFAKAISDITGQPFPYEEFFNKNPLKSAVGKKRLRPAPKLRERLDPLRTEMYIDKLPFETRQLQEK